MPYCSRCGQQVEETAVFCSNCGAPQKQQTQTGQPLPTSYSPSGRFRLGQDGANRGRMREIVERFRQKGARAVARANIRWRKLATDRSRFTCT